MDKDDIRVLYVNGGFMDGGGISSVMMNYYLNMDRSNLQIDFMVHGNDKGKWDDTILSNGSKIYHVTPRSKNIFKNIREIKEVYANGQYDIVHSHADAGNGHILKYAKKYQIPVRISHSHNTDYTISNKLRILFNELTKKSIKKYATDLWACSEKAGKWLYGGQEFEIIHNAIDINRFAFNPENRKKIRQQYGIGDDTLLVGMCGRFDTQKNQEYGLRAIAELITTANNVKLILVGDGWLRDKLTSLVKELDISDYVIFAGQVDNIEEYYSAMDVYIMPSLFEGFPVAAIEAQCNGLKCILSDQITKEARILDETMFLPIDQESIPTWCDEIKKQKPLSTRTDAKEIVKAAGYDIKTEAEKLRNKYMKLYKIEM